MLSKQTILLFIWENLLYNGKVIITQIITQIKLLHIKPITQLWAQRITGDAIYIHE